MQMAIRIEQVDAGSEAEALGLAPGDGGEQLEQALILDEPLFFQPVCHLVKAVLFVHGDGDLFFQIGSSSQRLKKPIL